MRFSRYIWSFFSVLFFSSFIMLTIRRFWHIPAFSSRIHRMIFQDQKILSQKINDESNKRTFECSKYFQLRKKGITSRWRFSCRLYPSPLPFKSWLYAFNWLFQKHKLAAQRDGSASTDDSFSFGPSNRQMIIISDFCGPFSFVYLHTFFYIAFIYKIHLNAKPFCVFLGMETFFFLINFFFQAQLFQELRDFINF